VGGRRLILVIAAAVAAVAAAGVVFVLVQGDDEAAVVSGPNQEVVSASESAPAAAAPVDEDAIAGEADYWTDERIERAIDNPLDTFAPAGPGANEPDAGPRKLQGTRTLYAGERMRPLGSTVGRILVVLEKKDGSKWESSCTGTVVDTGNRSTILTAGHCVREPGRWRDVNGDGVRQESEYSPIWKDANGDGFEQDGELTPRQWYSEVAFLPGYDNRVKTHGTWHAAGGADGNPLVFVHAGWNLERVSAYDFAAFVVAPQAGQTVFEKVGGGQRYGPPAGRDNPGALQSFGYPAVAPPAEFTGHALYVCAGTPEVGDSRDTVWEDAVLALGCDMTGGASGGPWLVGVDGNGVGTVVAVNSYKYNDEPQTILAPRFRVETYEGKDYAIGTNVVDEAGSVAVQPSG
jgi:hypothetical protein